MITAPPHSPPTAKPCRIRSATSRMGAATPIGVVGQEADGRCRAQVTTVVTSIFLRPTLSPKWPKMNPPIGRATKPTANVAKALSAPAKGSCGEEQRVEHQGRGGGEQEEVVPFDGGADQVANATLTIGVRPRVRVAGRPATSGVGISVSFQSSWAVTVL